MAIKFDTFKTGGAASGVTSVNTQTGAVVLSANDLAADHTASNYTASNANIDGHLSGIDTKLGTIAAGLTYKGSYNASTNSPALTNALQGDLYVVSAAGTQFGVDWQIGDHLLVNADMGGTIDNSKIDKIDNTEPAASETVAGIIEIATNAEAALGAATNRALVPSNISSLDLSTMDNSISGFISSVASASETVEGKIEIATNAEAAAGTATNKALVPSNISSLDLSKMDNTTAGFIAGITSESLNDLSDVQFTAGAPINNYVLTYDHSNTQWEAKAAASGGLSEIVQDTTPQLGGPLDVNGQEITSASNGNVAINPNGSGDISIGADLIPDADATHTIGDEDNRYISIYSDLNGAIRFKAKNNQGAAITKGQVVYISGVSGTVPEVKLARANSSATMPAFGLAQANANDQAEVEIVTFGNLTDYDTTTYSLSANDTVFVSAATAGALTNTAPTGEANLIQNIGRVVRADASAGIIKVGGAGRSNATPNLNQNKIFLGDASNQAVATALSSVALSSFNDDLNYLSNVVEDTTPQLGGNLDVNGQDIVSVSNGDIEFAANGTGTVKITPTTSGGHLVLQGDGTNAGKLVLNCEQNSHGITLKGPPHSAAASYTLTLPNNDGDADQVLKTDGSGALSWVDQPAGAAAASETVAGVIEIATNAEAAAGTATNKALVPSNISSLDLADMDNTTAGFISSVASASETVEGKIEIATNAEAAAGTATNKAIVPSNISSLDLSKMDNTTSGFISSVASASETVAGIIEIATDVEAAAATATDKALVPSNISSLDLSDMDNTTSGFISGITGESLNDLSDVSYTAGAGIDNYVLTYDHSTTSWGAEAAASGGLSEVVQDTTPQLGGPLDVNGQEITSASNGNVAINPDGSGDISIGADLIPDADATHTIGDEDNRYISTYSDLNGAIRFKAKNNQGAAISKGQVVYISGVSGTVPEVKLARANSSSTMPAFGLAQANANDQAEVEIVTFGNLTDYNTTTYSLSANDTVFVSAATAGALTNTAPTGEANLIQNIGRVVRADASAGIIKVGGAGRSNATPNLNQDKIFLGDASNQAVATALSSVALSSFNDDLSYLSNVVEDTTPQLGGNLDVNGQDIVSVSNGDIEFAANGTGTVKITPTTSGGHLVLQGDGTNAGKLVLNCEQNSHGITLKGPPHSAAASYALTLPNNDGNADQVLKTDGSGALSWVDQPAGASAASETVAGVIEIATNAEAAAATATDKALVPSNIASLDLSAMDNTTSGFIADIVTDTTPQLGGDLDVNGQAITSASNGLIEITPNGTGAIKFGGNSNPAEVRFFDEAGTNYVALKAPLDSAISADETFTLPATDGTSGQVLQTNGSGVLSFVDQSGGGASAPSVTAQNTTATLSAPASGTLEEVYTVNSSSAVTLTLVSAATVGEGFKYQIKRLGTGSVTVDPASTEYIDHSGQSTFAIGAQYDSITLISDGTNWLLI